MIGNLATDGKDLARLQEQLTFLPNGEAEIQCVDITAYNDTIYEGTEERAILLRNDDVRLEPKTAILEILDYNSKCLVQQPKVGK